MTELKPCPFCGGDNIDIMPADIITRTQYWRIFCFECGCTQTPTSNKEDAIKAWNKRGNPWHTGTPSEKGWYLQRIKSKNNISYDTDSYENGDWKYSCIFRKIIAWQKIEEKK